MRAKAWLVKQGHLESDGRGRMPLRVLPILQKAVESGVVFSDWPKGEVVVKKIDQTEQVRVKRDTSEAGFVEPAPYRFDERVFKAVETGSKRERSMREACSNCRASLVVCWCEAPRIVAIPPLMGSVAVRIEKR